MAKKSVSPTSASESFAIHSPEATEVNNSPEPQFAVAETIKQMRKAKKGELQKWIKSTCEETSVHGLVWYTRLDSVFVKHVIVLAVVFIIFCLPIWTCIQMVEFMQSTEISTNTEFFRTEVAKYPTITLCHANLFHKERMEAWNVSNFMANYLSMALDPNMKAQYENMAKYADAVKDIYDNTETQFKNLLEKNKMDILDLFRALAIKCDEMVIFCEIHRRTFDNFGSSENKTCCDVLFDKNPIFTAKGTCYKTNVTIYEHYAYTFSAIKLWADPLKGKVVDYEMIFKGSEALEKEGIFFAVGDKDHPAGTMLESNHPTAPSGSYSIGLRIVEEDRTGLSEDFCEKDPDAFANATGLPYTYLNCRVVDEASYTKNCSYFPYYGIRIRENEQPACKPSDLLKIPSLALADGLDGYVSEGITSKCKQECYKTAYVTNINVGKLNPDPIERFQSVATGIDKNVTSNLVLMQFYFESFDYLRHVHTQETLSDFLSKIGGWFGLAFGASCISFIELTYFFLKLIVHFTCSRK